MPISVPAGLRDAVLGAVRDLPAADRRGVHAVRATGEPPPVALEPAGAPAGPEGSSRSSRSSGSSPLGAGLLVDQAFRLDRAQRETAALEALAVTVDRVLRDPEHRVVDLRGADGTVEWIRLLVHATTSRS